MRGKLAALGIGLALFASARNVLVGCTNAPELRRAPPVEPALAGASEPVSPPRRVESERSPVVPVDSATTDEPAPATASSISGTVFGPDSRPVRPAEVYFVWDDRGREQHAYTHTRADGRFEITLPVAHVRGDVLAKLDDYELAPAALTGVEAGARGLELTLGEPAFFKVELRGPDEEPMTSDATWFAWMLAGHEFSDRSGDAWVRSPVPFTVHVTPHCGESASYGPFDPAQIGDTLVLHAKLYPRVHGQVVHGEEGIEAQIEVRAVGPEKAGDESMQDEDSAWRSVAPSDAHGDFEFCQQPGTYELRAFALPFGEGTLGPIVVDGEHDASGLRIELTRAPGAIAGRVLLPKGHDPAEIWLSASSAQGYRALGADGAFLIQGLQPGPCWVKILQGGTAFWPERRSPDGWISFVIDEILEAPPWLSCESAYRVDVPSGGVARLDIDLASPVSCRIRGSVRLDGAAPRLRPRPPRGCFGEGPAVTLDRGLEQQSDSESALASDGSFTLGTSTPGRYRLRVKLDIAGATDETWLVTDRLALVRGEREWKLELATGSLRILPPDADHPLWILPHVECAGPGERSIRVDGPELDGARGSCFFLRVPAGPVRVVREIAKGESKALECEIRAGETTEVRWPQ